MASWIRIFASKHLWLCLLILVLFYPLSKQTRASDSASQHSLDLWKNEVNKQFAVLEEFITQFKNNAQIRKRWETIAPQAFRPESLILKSDRDPADIVLRRTAALLNHLKSNFDAPDLSAEETHLAQLNLRNARIPVEDSDARLLLFERAMRLRQKTAFSNPLLNFDRILFVKRHRLPGAMSLGHHMCQQYYGFHALPGGGLFILENLFGSREKQIVRDVLADSLCQNGRFQGQKLKPGAFLSPELSFDGKTILFAYTQGEPTINRWTENSTYHIFKVNVDGSELTQLTDGPVNDFDPVWLPNGRIAFISERRGGHGRCHPTPKPLYTLASMNADGSDIVLLSLHEGNEWQPSIGHDGMLLYTRWDYLDRGNIQAHHAWITSPNGRDARPIHGNYGLTWRDRPLMEMDIRAIPDSHRLIATASAHHGQFYGSLILIDPRIEDDGAMSAVKRLTPEVAFPESEKDGGEVYASAWPLDEDFYLCVYDGRAVLSPTAKNHYGIYLVDSFGNHELIYRAPAISSLSPIPLRPCKKPPVLAEPAIAQAPVPPLTAPVAVINVYNSLKPFPEDTTIKALRIIQVLPKTTPLIDEPRIGYGNEKGARAVLGTVPVEADGSAYFNLPVKKPVYFQVLDENGLAVQSMRSDTYVHPGQKLLCQGCHEPRHSAPPIRNNSPMAFRREPSEIQPDVRGSNPFSYSLLVQPVLERNCVSCHDKEPKALDLGKGDWANNPHYWYTSYINLREYAFFFGPTQGKYDRWNTPRTIPGRFGARASKLLKILSEGHHDVKLSREEIHRIALWLDCNSVFFGSYENTMAQAKGLIVPPTME